MSTINLDDDQRLDDIYKLAKDNNRMLHAMRRDAFLHGLAKFVIYAAIVAVSFWVYVNYLGPMLMSLLKSLQTMANTGAAVQQQAGNLGQSAQDQLSSVTKMLDQVQSQLKNLPGGGQ
jgi:hypothetical protein